MDCKELHQTINELETRYNEVNRLFDKATKDGLGKKELTESSQKLSKLINEKLARYQDDFFKQFPGARIREEEIDRWPRHCRITSLAPLPDGSVIATGNIFLHLHRIAKDDKNEWTVEEQRDDLGTWLIRSVSSLPDDSLLVYVDSGEPPLGQSRKAFYANLNQYGLWEPEKDVVLHNRIFRSLVTLSDSEFMIGCNYLDDNCLLFYDLNDKYYNNDRRIIPMRRILLPNNSPRENSTITSLAKTPRGKVLVFRTSNDNYIVNRDDNGKWQIEKKLNELKDADNWPIHVNVSTSLPDGNLIIGAEEGGLYFATFDESDVLQIGKKILLDGFNEDTKVSSIALLPNNSLMIGSTNHDTSRLHQFVLQERSPETLKEAILEGRLR